MGNIVEDSLAILGAQTNLQDALKSNQNLTIIDSIVQFSALIATYTAKHSPEGALAANLAAALESLIKMEVEYSANKTMPSISDWLTLAGDVAGIVFSLSMIITPLGEAETAISITSSVIGGTQFDLPPKNSLPRVT